MEQSLIDSFYETEFHVLQNDVIIKIGQINPALDRLLDDYNATVWAYITPWNPYCTPLSEQENMDRLLKLKRKLEDYTVLEGCAKSSDISFQPERCYLITGISREDAEALGKEFQQYAIITGKKGNPAELIILV